jgi:hypothetical protein
MLPPRTVAGVVLAELLMCATVWGSWIAQYGTVAALGVGLGLSGPGDWPPIFGSPADADSVAGFWGRFWPGILRQVSRTGSLLASPSSPYFIRALFDYAMADEASGFPISLINSPPLGSATISSSSSASGEARPLRTRST